jgi:hypothetical protein
VQKGLWVYDKRKHANDDCHLHRVQQAASLIVRREQNQVGVSTQKAMLRSSGETFPSQGRDDGEPTPNMIQLCPPLIREIKRAQGKKRSILRYTFGKIESSIKKHLTRRQIGMINPRKLIIHLVWLIASRYSGPITVSDFVTRADSYSGGESQGRCPGVYQWGFGVY